MLRKNRDQFRNQIRRHHLQMIFARQRQKVFLMEEAKFKAQFTRVYPLIHQGNYDYHKQFLSSLVVSDDFSYQLTPFAGIVYDYLLQHKEDGPSIKILNHISKFEEIEIPQTLQFAELLRSMIFHNMLDSIIIASNLMSFPKYQSLLRDRLLQFSYIQQIFSQVDIQIISEQTKRSIKILMGDLLCSMLISQPILQTKSIQKIVKNLANLCEQEEVMQGTFGIFPIMRQRVKPQKSYASIILTYLQEVIIKERHGFQIYILEFLIFCAYSDVYTNKLGLLNLIIDPILSSKYVTGPLIQKALECACIYLDCNEQFMEMFDISSNIGKVWKLLFESQGNAYNEQMMLKIICLGQAEDIIGSIMDPAMIESAIYTLIKSLQTEDHWMLGNKIIKTILAEGEEGVQTDFLRHFEYKGGFSTVQKILLEKNGQKYEELRDILQMMDKISNEGVF